MSKRGSLKILFLADTHLGFDLPLRPRVQRRRRGEDFFKNYLLALQPAFDKQVDLVIHGGDLFFRSRVHPKIVNDAFAPLMKIADQNIPVFIVPGNHERSNIPQSLFDTHPSIHIFDKPRTFYLTRDGITLALAGFPYYKNGIRKDIKKVAEQTGHQKEHADMRLLCMHQIVEGAQVGIQNYTFRSGEDVIHASDIPADFLAVLSGHIHRWQVLTKDLEEKLLKAPILYPGAIERTSFVERAEQKGYLIIEVGFFQNAISPEIKWTFHELPTRPMDVIDIDLADSATQNLASFLQKKIVDLDPNGVVKLRFSGWRRETNHDEIKLDWIRSVAPRTMNIEIAPTKRG